MKPASVHSQASRAILDQRAAIVAALAERHAERMKRIAGEPADSGSSESVQDADDHIAFLAQALALNNQQLFDDYIAWAKVLLGKRDVPAGEVATYLTSMVDALRRHVPGEVGDCAATFVENALSALPGMPDDIPTFLSDTAPLAELARQYFHTLHRGDRHRAGQLIHDAVAAGTSVRDIYLHVFQVAQYELGRLWQTNRISVAQEHFFTASTQFVMSQLFHHVFASARIGRTLVATTVAGELHELGVRMVADFFEMDGWDTFYLGANTPHASVATFIVERRSEVLAVSATISHHVVVVRELVQAVRGRPDCSNIKILVGGYPFNQTEDLWRTIGADGYARDAQQAIALANQLVAGDRK